MREGNEQFEKRNFRRSLNNYNAALDHDSTSYEALYNRANAYYQATATKAEDDQTYDFKTSNALYEQIAADTLLTDVQRAEIFRNLGESLFTQQEYEAEYGKKPLGEFVREIVGLDMAAAKAAFAEYLSNVNLDADQIYFVNQIIEYIVRNGVMKDLSVLQEPPFTDRGSIVEVFTDLSVWIGIKAVIDRINANAAA